MVKQVQVLRAAYQSNDGKTYDTEIEALRADEAFRAKSDHVFHYSRTWNGQRLLEKHDLSEYGTWRVYGEDPNCDMGGHHHEPDLGYFEGTLEQVINKAYTLPGWMTWGGGGRIVRKTETIVVKL